MRSYRSLAVESDISVERMTTLFATSPDGTRVAYDCSGTGTALVLLHGGTALVGRPGDWRVMGTGTVTVVESGRETIGRAGDRIA